MRIGKQGLMMAALTASAACATVREFDARDTAFSHANVYDKDNVLTDEFNNHTAKDIVKKVEQTTEERLHRVSLAEEKRAKKNAKRLANR